MDWKMMEGNLKQFKGRLQETWGNVTHNELNIVEGKRNQLVGQIQTKYGIGEEEAEEQVDDLLNDFMHDFYDPHEAYWLNNNDDDHHKTKQSSQNNTVLHKEKPTREL